MLRTQIAFGVGLIHSALQDRHFANHLATNVDVGMTTAERVRRQNHALDKQVRIPEDHLAIFAGTRLGLVGIAD